MAQIDWRDGDDEAALRQRYKTEPDPALRPRLHLLWLVRQGKQIQEAAQLVGVHDRTARQWMAWYRHGGVTALCQPRRGNRQGMPCRLNGEQQAQLFEQAKAEGFLTVNAARAWVQDRFGVSYTESGMGQLLRRLKLRKKVPRPRNAKASEAVQSAWKKGA
ncbi:MAG TPA: winged helix-turn-helix domain-containing protein [Chloroflexota bacterium]|nr:winged helix-turn-helix domain-containing protein [Chloroflexota bacterium]